MKETLLLDVKRIISFRVPERTSPNQNVYDDINDYDNLPPYSPGIGSDTWSPAGSSSSFTPGGSSSFSNYPTGEVDMSYSPNNGGYENEEAFSPTGRIPGPYDLWSLNPRHDGAEIGNKRDFDTYSGDLFIHNN